MRQKEVLCFSMQAVLGATTVPTISKEALEEPPGDFWPTIDSWYWGGSCFVCRLGLELGHLRLERHRVRLALIGVKFERKDLPTDEWESAVCEDVAALVVDASSEMGGSFLKHLESVLSGDHPRVRPDVSTSSLVQTWISAFVHDAINHGPSASNERFAGSGRWLWRYQYSLRESVRAVCSSSWTRDIGPSLRAETGLNEGCPCIDASTAPYRQLEQSRAWLTSLVYPSRGLWGMCEHLISLLEGWRVLRTVLPPPVLNVGQVLQVSCAMARMLLRTVQLRNDLNNFSDPLLQTQTWFHFEDKDEFDANVCMQLAVKIDSDMRVAIQHAHGMIARRSSPLEGRNVCEWLAGVPQPSRNSRQKASLAYSYFSKEGLVQTLDSMQHRAFVPFRPHAADSTDVSSLNFFGPWRSSYGWAVRDRMAVHSALVALDIETPLLHSLLEAVDDSLVYYRTVGVFDRWEDGSKQEGSIPASSIGEAAAHGADALNLDIGEVLEKEDAKWERDLFDSLRSRAAANVVAEVGALQLPFTALCAQLEEPTLRLRWLGRAVLTRWCYGSDEKLKCKANPMFEELVDVSSSEAVASTPTDNWPIEAATECPPGCSAGHEFPDQFSATPTQTLHPEPAADAQSTALVVGQEFMSERMFLYMLALVGWGLAGWMTLLTGAAWMKMRRLQQVGPPSEARQTPTAHTVGNDIPLLNLDLSALVAAPHRERILQQLAHTAPGPAPAA